MLSHLRRDPHAVVVVRGEQLRILRPPYALTIEGDEAVRAQMLLERAAVAPLSDDEDDGFDGRLIRALHENGVLFESSEDDVGTLDEGIRPTVKVVYGITAAIDAVRAPLYLGVLRNQPDFEVRVVMTPSATHLVSPQSLRLFSGFPVDVEMFGGETAEHVVIGKWSDVVVVIPASAEFICRLSAGIYSDLLAATVAMAAGAVVLAPAMNERMWRRRAVQRAIADLTSAEGFNIVLPGQGQPVAPGVGAERAFGGVGLDAVQLPLLIRSFLKTRPESTA